MNGVTSEKPADHHSVSQGLRLHFFPQMSRVTKCHFFYTDQIFQTNFYPNKSAETVTNLMFELNKIVQMATSEATN